MKFRVHTFALGLVIGLAIIAAPARAGDGDVEAVMKIMPAGFPLSAVVVNFEKLDKSIIAFGKAVDPQSESSGMLADLKSQVGVAEWIDFSKPMGFVQPKLQGGEPILWATASKFTDKAKSLPNAKEEEGVWFLPFEGKDDLYAVVRGDLIIAGSDKTLLMSAAKVEGKSFADELKPRMDLLTNRDALVHLNLEPIRPMALGGISQAAQMAPMFAMIGAQQGGMDPAALTAVISAVIDGIKRFLEQAAFVDIAVGVSASDIDATIACGFSDGAIKSYLAQNKPAGAALLAGFEDQPFTLAMGWNVPGKGSPFFDYVFDKMQAAAPAPPEKPAGEGAAPDSGAPAAEKSASAENDAMKEAMQISREMYRKIEGQNMLMNMSSKGMISMGYYIGEDANSIVDLAKKTLLKANPLAKSLSGGVNYEVGESKKIGGVAVDQFLVKLDPNNPAAIQAAKMFGENLSILMGVAGGNAAFHMGPAADAEKFFSGKVVKPLVSGQFVGEALKALPQKRNAVVLIDPAGVLPALAPLLGMPATQDIPPGPPVAVSVLLSGDYARADVHVPARAIGRVIQAVSPQPPM